MEKMDAMTALNPQTYQRPLRPKQLNIFRLSGRAKGLLLLLLLLFLTKQKSKFGKEHLIREGAIATDGALRAIYYTISAIAMWWSFSLSLLCATCYVVKRACGADKTFALASSIFRFNASICFSSSGTKLSNSSSWDHFPKTFVS